MLIYKILEIFVSSQKITICHINIQNLFYKAKELVFKKKQKLSLGACLVVIYDFLEKGELVLLFSIY